MKVRVEACWNGHKHYFRLTIPPKSSREFVVAEQWGRKEATEALDLLEYVYKIPRKSVRFDVR